MVLKVTEEGKKKLLIAPRSVQITPGLPGIKPPSRTERLETFREVHGEQEDAVKMMNFQALRRNLEIDVKDESKASDMYDKMAEQADMAGLPGEAATLRMIAADERRHFRTISEMQRKIERMSFEEAFKKQYSVGRSPSRY
jgi:rubrerythrin